MLKILKYLRAHAGAAALIVALLIVQAYCDLSLPTYTSQIVDVGIQQSGIDRSAPVKLREQTMQDLELFMTQEQIDLVEGAYDLEDGVYARNTNKTDILDRLDEAMELPMLLVGQLSAMTAQIDLPTLRAAAESGSLTKKQLLELTAEAADRLEEQPESLAGQMAVQFIKEEYEALGVDLNKIQMHYLLITGLKMLALSLVMVVAAILVGLLSARTAAKVGMELRGAVFEKVVSFSGAELDRFSTASLITRSTNDVQQVQMVTVMLLRMVLYAPIVGLFAVFKVMQTNTGMSWIIGVAVGLVLLLVTVLMNVAMPKFKKMQKLIDRLNLVAREILTGIPVIRAFSRERYEEQRFDGANQDLKKTQLFTNRVMTFMMPTMMLVMNGISLLIVWNGAHGVDLGTMQVGDMIAFITYTMQIVMAFLMISMISIMLPRAAVSAGRIDEVLQTKPAVADAAQPCDDRLENCRGVVCFEDVSFRYPDADTDVLEHISFTAQPGQMTAIIGSTGSGKSTLLNLIPRFFDVTEGRITLDGVDIRAISQQKLRSLLGYVPQKGVLFSGDIASNVKFGGPSITDQDMVRAAQIAQAESFIQEKPEQYQAPIAQGGSNVSGGQKQRLSIARAIAKDPKVFLFDDSFSALDYKTDAALRKALAEQVKDATVLIVAQRISTVVHAQQIIVLRDGSIAGIGTHEELMASCQTYQEIARSQLSEAELGGLTE